MRLGGNPRLTRIITHSIRNQITIQLEKHQIVQQPYNNQTPTHRNPEGVGLVIVSSPTHYNHDVTSNFIDQLYSYGLHPLIMRPTRITKESATIIDNIFTNELQRINSSGLIINDLSDHLPIFQICDYTDDVHSSRNQYKTKETRLINDQTLQHFSNALSSASWDDIVNDHDVHHSYHKFINGVFRKPLTAVFRSDRDLLLKNGNTNLG